MTKFLDKFDKKVQKWAARIGAIVTIVGAITAGGSWLLSQINDNLAAKLEEQTSELQQEVQKLSDKVDTQDKKTDLQLTRLELMSLMENDPTNVVEIEKVANHYFNELKGNYYMDSEYSRWCKAYEGDCEIMFK